MYSSQLISLFVAHSLEKYTNNNDKNPSKDKSLQQLYLHFTKKALLMKKMIVSRIAGPSTNADRQ